ncbi:MAG TPA: Bax inhibitor-1 family protein [Granulicella sp.]|nr:Bax inhibitor-1 family protein [Granulicella sp.]
MAFPARQQELHFMMESRFNAYPRILDVPREETASLLAKVLAITALGFLVTALGVATAPVWSALPGIIAVFALVFAINAARRSNPGLALGLFMALSYFMGWEIGPLIHRYVAAFGSALVFNAAATTGCGMAAMGSVAYLFQINYRRLTGIAFAGLLVLLLLGILSIFLHFLSPTVYSWMTLGIFTLLTVGDFARIRAGGDGRSAVSLALSIYLDAINIFLAVLQLMSGRRRD